jgi:hypothetical protein
MDLSKQTRVEVIDGLYGIYVKMTRENAKGTRWLNINKIIIDKMTEKVTVINEAIKNKKDKMIEITDKSQIEVKKYLEHYYVCFMIQTQKQDQEMYVNRMNLNVHEWDAFAKILKKIKKNSVMKRPATVTQAVPETPAKKQKKPIVRIGNEEIIQNVEDWFNYRWSDSETVSHCSFFTEKDCIDHHAKYGKGKEEPIVTAIIAPFPSSDLWVDKVALYLVQNEVRALAKKDCDACKIDDPSQFHHTRGCIDQWEDIVEKYYDIALTHITADEIMTFFNNTMIHCERKERLPQPYFIKFKTSRAVRKVDIVNSEYDDDFHTTFDIVREMFYP